MADGILDIEAGEVYVKTMDAANDPAVKVIANEGGARSSKTWSNLILLIAVCFAQSNKAEGLERFYMPDTKYKITISRARLTWLRSTVLLDFEEILTKYNIPHYPAVNINRPDQTYYINGNTISFIGLDEKMKLHGRKQHIFWLNEAMETKYASFYHLAIRTSILFLLDYNPSAIDHWIYDKVIGRDDCAFIHSTMLQNPFLEATIREEILRSEPTDANIKTGTADQTLWNIYGLGLRSAIGGLIFPNITIVKDFPEDAKRVARGLDFGYVNDATAVIRCGIFEGGLYMDEEIYETGLVNIHNAKAPQMRSIEKRLSKAGIKTYDEVVADSAERKSIAELRGAGFNFIAAKKGAGSVNHGIDIIKRYPLFITERSVNLLKEQRNYKWAEHAATGELTNTPVDAFNHGFDAVRYYAQHKLPTVRKRVR